MAATTTLTMAPTVRHRFARTATLATIRTLVRLTDTGDLITSWTACSSELAPGMDGDTVADFAVTADLVADFMMAADLVVDLIVVDSLGADSMAGRDLQIGAASGIEGASLAALPVGIAAASLAVAEAFMAEAVSMAEAADSTVVVADRMEAADSTVVVADRMEAAVTVAAIGN